LASTRSLACESKKAHEQVTTGSPEQSGIPRAMVLTVSFVFSPETGFVASVAGAMSSIVTDLTPASGCQDCTTSPSALTRSSAAPKTSTASHPTFVTIAIRPSWWRGMAQLVPLILGRDQPPMPATY